MLQTKTSYYAYLRNTTEKSAETSKSYSWETQR
jgi:hypothetical protein